MRTLIFITSFMLLTACGEANNQAQIVVPESAQKVSLAVSNMTCSTCGPTVRRALQQVDGVYKATVDLKAHTATVYFDPTKTEVPSLTQATTVAGYPSEALL
jgi:mercuric ion binding protein